MAPAVRRLPDKSHDRCLHACITLIAQQAFKRPSGKPHTMLTTVHLASHTARLKTVHVASPHNQVRSQARLTQVDFSAARHHIAAGAHHLFGLPLDGSHAQALQARRAA